MTLFSRAGLAHRVSKAAVAVGLVFAAPTIAFAQEVPPAAAAPVAANTGWGAAIADIAPDPAVTYGTLPNGMKYALRKNDAAVDGATVRLVVDVGWVDEKEGERGAAHFLEHMALNGSTKFPEGEVIKTLERMGLSFGADTNASTTFDVTNFKLDLPHSDEKSLDTALTVMREIGGNLTIAPDAVDRERGIILAERATRNSPDRRQLRALLENAAPQSGLGQAVLTDDAGDTNSLTAAGLRKFYERNYRPEKSTLLMVGNIDVAAIEAKIRGLFSDWKGVGPALPAVSRSHDPAAASSQSNFVNQAASSAVMLSRVEGYRPDETSMKGFFADLNALVAQVALGQRFDKLALANGATTAGGFSTSENIARAIRLHTLSVVAKNDDWKAALGQGEQELRRALQYGFTRAEIDSVLAKFDGIFQSRAQQQPSRNNREFVESLEMSALDGSFITLPVQDLDNFKKARSIVTAETVSAALRKVWEGGPRATFVSSKVPIADFANVASATLADSAKIAVTPPQDATVKAFAYDDFGKAGKVVADKRIADLGIRTIRFANGVMLNIRKSDSDKGKVSFALRVGDGLRSMKAMPPGLDTFMKAMSRFDGLGQHDFNELQQLIAGKAVSPGLEILPDAISASGQVTPQDLELQLKLLAASVSDFGFRPETDQLWQTASANSAAGIMANPVARMQNSIFNITADGDRRFGLADPNELTKRSMAELRTAISDQLAKGQVRIALTGDVDEAAAIELVAKTFGALPKRQAKAMGAKSLYPVSFPTDRSLRNVLHSGTADQGVVAMAWPTTDDSDLKSALTRQLLAELLQMKMLETLREKMGAVYTPRAVSVTFDGFRHHGFIWAFAEAKPEFHQAVSAAIGDAVRELRVAPVDVDMLQRARQPMLDRYEKQDRDSGSWAPVVAVAQTQPERLDRRRKRKSVLASITAADIQAAAKLYLGEREALELRTVPKAQPASAQPQ